MILFWSYMIRVFFFRGEPSSRLWAMFRVSEFLFMELFEATFVFYCLCPMLAMWIMVARVKYICKCRIQSSKAFAIYFRRIFESILEKEIQLLTLKFLKSSNILSLTCCFSLRNPSFHTLEENYWFVCSSLLQWPDQFKLHRVDKVVWEIQGSRFDLAYLFFVFLVHFLFARYNFHFRHLNLISLSFPFIWDKQTWKLLQCISYCQNNSHWKT